MLRTMFSCEAGVEPHLQEAVARAILFPAVDFAEHDYHDAECDDTFNEKTVLELEITYCTEKFDKKFSPLPTMMKAMM